VNWLTGIAYMALVAGILFGLYELHQGRRSVRTAACLWLVWSLTAYQLNMWDWRAAARPAWPPA
jgi:hypothetical protein